MRAIQIAIDGTVAAGKGTTAKLVAQRLGYLYVDTGAIYRAITLYLLENGLEIGQKKEIVETLMRDKPQIMLSLPETDEEKDGRLSTVRLNGQDVSWQIRTERVSKATSPVAQIVQVREYANKVATALAQTKNVVMEGRDITTVVLPQADLRIYMDADPKERAARRHRELLMRGENITFQEVLEDLVARDELDMKKNLVRAPGVWYLDTSQKTIEQVALLIIEKVKRISDEKEKTK